MRPSSGRGDDPLAASCVLALSGRRLTLMTTRRWWEGMGSATHDLAVAAGLPRRPCFEAVVSRRLAHHASQAHVSCGIV